MSDLTSLEKTILEKFLDMGSGYVLNFSNRSFQEFIFGNTGIDIYNQKYDYESGSKANRLRAFWKKEGNIIVGQLLINFLEHWELNKTLNSELISLTERDLFDRCMTIAKRLTDDSPITTPTGKKCNPQNKDQQLDNLLIQFDGLAKSNDFQKRGYALEGLLTQLLELHNIPIKQSFKRNNGGEQIDGAFSYDGWYYLVECKWTNKLAGIRELDSLLGKVNRSGKQGMGLFLSIEGWSKELPQILKQNPEKCIILMDGYDLR